MSAELLAILGRVDAMRRQSWRAVRVEHAAARTPGAREWEIHEVANGVIALVHTDPPGGSHARVAPASGGLRAALACTPAALDAAWRSPDPRSLGAEAGHVLIEVNDGGACVSGDGVAFVPAYWTVQEDELAVATHLASIPSLGVMPHIDDQGAVEYLVHMHPWGSRTLLADTHLLGQGGQVCWAEGNLTVADRPLYPAPSEESMSDEDAVATFARLWPEVIGDLAERGSGRRTLMALSGGMDSRAMVAGAVDIGWRPMTYTYGSSRVEEAVAAREVAEELGLAQLMIPVTEDRLLRDPSGMLDVLDGAHCPAEMYELWFDDILRAAGDVVVNGMIAGPMWGDDKALGLQGHSVIAAHLERRFAGDLAAVAPLLAIEVEEVRAMVRAGIAESLQGWDLEGRDDLVMFWKQGNKMVRWGSMLTNALRRRGLAVEAPFLDSRFVAYSRRLTPEQRRNGALYLRVHREVFAAVAGVPRGDDGNPPASLSHVYWSGERSFGRQMVDLAREHPLAAFRRGGRRLGDIAAGKSGQWGARWHEWRSVFPSSRFLASPTYRARLADLLEAGLGAHSILDDDAVAAVAERLRAGEQVASPLALARVGALGGWVKDYRSRYRDTR